MLPDVSMLPRLGAAGLRVPRITEESFKFWLAFKEELIIGITTPPVDGVVPKSVSKAIVREDCAPCARLATAIFILLIFNITANYVRYFYSVCGFTWIYRTPRDIVCFVVNVNDRVVRVNCHDTFNE